MAIVNNHANHTQSAKNQQGAVSNAAATGQATDRKLLSDEVVTLNPEQINAKNKDVPLKEYKSRVGQDTAYIKETLRNKLAEYRQHPGTKLQLNKDMFGQIQVSGPITEQAQAAISRDLNNNNPFKAAFNRLSTDQPTLDYVEKVTKLSKAYGVSNNLFSSLVSKQADNNSLTDIAHRFQALKQTYQTTAGADFLSDDQPYQLTVNA